MSKQSGQITVIQSPAGYEVSYAWRTQIDVLTLGGILGVSLPLTITALILPLSAGGLVLLILTLAVEYVGLAMVVNRSSVKVTIECVSVRHGPLPWPGRRSVRLDELYYIFTMRVKGGKGYSYSVVATMLEGGAVRLVERITHERTATHLADAVRECALKLGGLTVWSAEADEGLT